MKTIKNEGQAPGALNSAPSPKQASVHNLVTSLRSVSFLGLGKTPGGPKCELSGALRRHWNIWKYSSIKLRFPRAKEFPRKFSAVWALAVRKLRRQSLIKNIIFKGREIINLPGAPTCVGPALDAGTNWHPQPVWTPLKKDRIGCSCSWVTRRGSRNTECALCRYSPFCTGFPGHFMIVTQLMSIFGKCG